MRLSLRLLFMLVVMVGLMFPGKAIAERRPRSPGINRRQHRQEKRIQQGVKSGELTREEAQTLRQEQKAVRQEERQMKSDGVLTKEERKELHQDLNKSSQHIHDEKHDAEKR